MKAASFAMESGVIRTSGLRIKKYFPRACFRPEFTPPANMRFRSFSMSIRSEGSQLRNGIGGDQDIGIEDKEVFSPGLLQAGVHSPREHEVPVVLDEHHRR